MATAYNELEIILYASVKYIYNFPFTFVKMEVKVEEYNVW